jgi:hypothetical protein
MSTADFISDVCELFSHVDERAAPAQVHQFYTWSMVLIIKKSETLRDEGKYLSA